MFDSKRAMTAREVGSAHGKLLALMEQRDSWYDGTVASVDNRTSAVRNTIASVDRVAATDHEMLAEASRLRNEERSLSALRTQLLNPGTPDRAMPKTSSVAPLTARGRKFIAGELRGFMADNADAATDVNEMDVRAEDHAELQTMQLPMSEAASVVAHFRLAVNWTVRDNNRRNSQDKKDRPTARTASADTFPDDMLFD